MSQSDATGTSSWSPIDLADTVAGIRAGEIVGPVPTLMTRSDGVSLLYPGEVHSLAGEPETGKGWVTLGTCATVIADGQRVLYLDFEDAAASIVTRLLALQAQPEAIVERFVYVRPVDSFTAAEFWPLIRDQAYALAVIDGVSEAYSLLGLDPYSNPDAVKFFSQLPRPITDRTGAAGLLVDHVVKTKENRGRYAIGAQHKLAGLAVAYSTEALTRPSRTIDGVIKIHVEKDRHGHIRGHAQGGVIALARIQPRDDGQHVTVTLDPPDTTSALEPAFRPTTLMTKVSKFVQENPGASKRTVISGVTGKNEYVEQALLILIAEDYIHVQIDGQAQRHHHHKPFHADDRSPVPQPFPTAPQDTVNETVPPFPAPYKGGTGQDTVDPDYEAERLTAKFGTEIKG